MTPTDAFGGVNLPHLSLKVADCSSGLTQPTEAMAEENNAPAAAAPAEPSKNALKKAQKEKEKVV
jgi:hypothetical protein